MADNDTGWNLDAVPDKLRPYADTFQRAGEASGINPKVLMAIAMQENVAEGDLNPLGLSDDSGPYHFQSPEEAEEAIYHQAYLMASPTGPYRNATNLDELAAIYSPPGAANDPYGTNIGEASGIRANLAKLGGSDDLRENAGLSDEEMRQKYLAFLPNYPEQPEEEKPEEKPAEKPEDKQPEQPSKPLLDRFKDKFPVTQGMSDDDIIQKYIQPYAPDVPLDKLKTFVKNPEATKLINGEKNQPKNLLQKFRDEHSDFFKGKSDDEVAHYMYDGLKPQESFDAFKDKIKPWRDSDDAIQNLVENSAHNFLPAAASTLKESAAGMWSLASGDLEKSLFGTVIGKDGLAAIDKWRNDNLGNLDFMKDFVNWMQGNKQVLQASAAEDRKKLRPGWSSYPGTVVGGFTGKLPEMAVTFGGGPLAGVSTMATAEAAGVAEAAGLAERPLIGDFTKQLMAWAGSFGAAKGYVKAYEEGAKYPILGAVKDGAVDATGAWLFNSGSGWLSTGLGNVALNMDEDKLKAFFSGNKNEVWQAIAGTSIDALLGAASGLEHGVWGNMKIPDAARYDLDLAREARVENIAKAKELVDRAFALMPEDLQHAIVDHVITTTQDLSKNVGDALKVKPLEPSSDQPVDLSDFRLRQEHPFGELHFDPDEALGRGLEVGVVEPESGLKHDPYSVLSGYEPGTQLITEIPGKEEAKTKGAKPKRDKPKKPKKPEPESVTASKATVTPEPVKPEYRDPLATDEDLGMSLKGMSWKEAKALAKEAEEKAPEKTVEEKKKADYNIFTDHVMFGNGHAPVRKGGRMGDRGQMGSIIDPVEIIRQLIEWDRDLTYKILPRVPGKLFEKFAPEELKEVASNLKELKDYTFPEFKSQTSMEAAARVGKAHAAMEFETAQQQNELFRRENFQSEFLDGDLAARRSGYQKKFTKAQQLEMLLNAEENKPTGDPVMDRMAEIRRAGYKMMGEAEEALGMGHVMVNDYLYHVYDKRSLEKFDQQYFKGMPKPSFMKPREWMTYREALAASRDPLTGEPMVKPKTLDQEMIWRMRVWDHNRNKHMIYTIRDWENEGKAFSTKEEDLPEGVEHWPVLRSPSEDDGSFHVHPDAFAIVRNAWFPTPDTMEKALGTWGTFSKWLKMSTTPFRMAWSIAHEIHLPLLRMASKGSMMLSAPTKYSPKQWAQMLFLDAPTLGYGTMIKDYFDQRSLLDIYQSKRSINDTTLEERNAVSQLLDSGFSARLSHEREIEFSDWLRENGPKWQRGFTGRNAQAINVAVDWLTMQPVQKWAFGRMIPAAKMAQVLEGIKNAEMKNPDLLDSKNAPQRLVVLRSIQQTVDKRLGELNFNNIFWPKALKDAGIGTFFSLGWQMGLIDYNGGMVKAFTGNKFHMENVEHSLLRAAGKDQRWDALRFGAMYTMASMIQGAIQNYLGTGQAPTSWQDYFNPRTGRTAANGEPERWRTLNWPSETIALWNYIQAKGSIAEGSSVMASHKLNPTLSSIAGAISNSDYLGRFISDPNDPSLKQAWDTMLYLLKENYSPMSGEAYVHAGKQALAGKLSAQDIKEAFASFLGSTRAPAAMERTPIENRIMNEYEHEFGHARELNQINELHFAYKQALDAGDQTAADKALQDLRDQGVEEKQIDKLKDNVTIPSAMRLLKRLHAPIQKKIILEMSSEDREKYLPYASKKVQKELEDEMPTHPGTGLYMPKTPQHALTLAPGTKFHDPQGRLRMVPAYA